MESFNETKRMGLVRRAVAFGLAVASTGVIATGTAVIFSGNPQSAGRAFVDFALAPLRAVFGG
jgi:hypothetical protein